MHVRGLAVALAVPVSLTALAGVGRGPAPGPEDASAEGRTTIAPGDPGAAAALTCSDAAPPAEVVPSSVVAARMCDTDSGVASWFAPQDGLHADLVPLLAVLASGQVVSILGDTGGCSTVRIGGEDLLGSDEVLATFLGLTRWGDVVALRGVCRGFLAAPAELWQADPDQAEVPPQPFWHPSPRTQRILDGLRR